MQQQCPHAMLNAIYVHLLFKKQMKKKDNTCLEDLQKESTTDCNTGGRKKGGVPSSLPAYNTPESSEQLKHMSEDQVKPGASTDTYCKGGPTTTNTTAAAASDSPQPMRPMIQTAADSRSSSVCSIMLPLQSSQQQSQPGSGALNKYLYRRVKNTVMSIVVPLGRKKRNAEKSTVAGREKLNLPRKTSFVFTEDDALQKIVKRIFKECPVMARCKDREGFLVRLIQLMEQTESSSDE
jgi:hypothetical protein